MVFNQTSKKFIIRLFVWPEDSKETISIVFPNVTEFREETHAEEESDCLDDVLGIIENGESEYVITTQVKEFFLKSDAPFEIKNV